MSGDPGPEILAFAGWAAFLVFAVLFVAHYVWLGPR